jgi:hypothetical protein
MRKLILKYSLLVSLLLFSCRNKKDEKCAPFCNGDEWFVEEFRADPYPLILPLEKNQFLTALELEGFSWRLSEDEILTLSNNNRDKTVLKYEIIGDTLLLSTGNKEVIKLVLREEAKKRLHLELIGLVHGHIYLQKKN